MALDVKSPVDDECLEKGVRHLCELGVTRVPRKYVLPAAERPSLGSGAARVQSHLEDLSAGSVAINLPIVDLAELEGPNRENALKSLAAACSEHGFFQLINHGIPDELIGAMIDVSRRFFELPFSERSRYMTSDITAPVRYGTSFNQRNDGVYCWRDFLKLGCHPLRQYLPFWPCSPIDLREAVGSYAKHTRSLFLKLAGGIVESLGISPSSSSSSWGGIMRELQEGSQLLVMNCYPSCPQPELTLGMPPHSDYGFLTLLLQDGVAGLQVQQQGRWVDVQPFKGSFVVNVGDHLEIFSNGKYKSVLHRVVVNSSVSRISAASLHSLPFSSAVRPAPELVDEQHPRMFKDTDFSTFLNYLNSCEAKSKNFLESRKLVS
ncbi:DMR6-LIKE OXYGENASE 2 protein [Nymphaea thermarum]|nr:DMR6-LIKE OXYGENASE 2 protein [Nymphaea thermarum]